MTENNVHFSTVCCKPLSERIRRRPSGQLLSADRTAHKMENAARTMFFSRKKPPYAANFPFRGIQKLQRHFREVRVTLLWTSDTSSSSELEHSKTTSGSGAPLSILRHGPPPKPAQDILHEPRTRILFLKHPYGCRQTPVTADKTKDSPNCSLFFSQS